jgi:hypothetical protein
MPHLGCHRKASCLRSVIFLMSHPMRVKLSFFLPSTCKSAGLDSRQTPQRPLFNLPAEVVNLRRDSGVAEFSRDGNAGHPRWNDVVVFFARCMKCQMVFNGQEDERCRRHAGARDCHQRRHQCAGEKRAIGGSEQRSWSMFLNLLRDGQR